MIQFVLGAIAAASLYTFWPSLAVVPSAWLRALYAKLRGLAADGVGEADEYKPGGSSSED